SLLGNRFTLDNLLGLFDLLGNVMLVQPGPFLPVLVDNALAGNSCFGRDDLAVGKYRILLACGVPVLSGRRRALVPGFGLPEPGKLVRYLVHPAADNVG